MKGSVRITGVVLVLILSFLPARGEAQGTVADATLVSAGPAGVVEEIEAAEQSFTNGLVAVDIPMLERLLTDDFTWTHTSGGVEMKNEYLKGVLDTRRYKGFRREGTTFRIYEKSALSSGTVQITVFDQRGGRVLEIRYTAAYVLQEGMWRLAAWHNTRLPEN